MSSDIYIPLKVVLSHPVHFELKAALNGDVENARQALYDHPIDWEYIEYELEPVLLCKFGARETWRPVGISAPDPEFEPTAIVELHVCCGGSFRQWLMTWLESHNYPYTII